ncbi:TetR/AcrR family transcriptional regulator [Kribbella sp. NBC_01505]|uniref:TetR/AcrR family transcriptional regulator n=1 Tax=Kribbella sp. NBC_01505 TaxID=2903580 RepID=UPI003862FFFB
MTPPRIRRPPEEARLLILNAAAALLAEGGAPAVQVRAVAARVGMTDTGVTHHFQNRDNLLQELLRHGGRQLRTALQTAIASWLEDSADLHALVQAFADVYNQGYGELAIALHAAGWRDTGSGMLDPVVDALHQLRPATASLTDTRLAVAALHQAMATESLYGPAFRRSAGLTTSTSADQLTWWTRQLHLALDL